MSRGRYDRPATTADGSAFENLVEELHLSILGFDIGLHRDSERQFAIGESERGVEIKWLKNSRDRLHIEIEHRTSTSSQWRPGGIYRKDNAKTYVCGNNDDIWAFTIADLIAWHIERKPHEVWYGKDRENRHRMLDPEHDDVLTLATIRSFVLKKSDALSFYHYRFIRQLDGGYELLRRGVVDAAPPPRGPTATDPDDPLRPLDGFKVGDLVKPRPGFEEVENRRPVPAGVVTKVEPFGQGQLIYISGEARPFLANYVMLQSESA